MINFLCNPSRHGLPCATAVRFSRWGLRADGRGQGRAVAASSGTPLFAVMPGLVPLLSGLEIRRVLRAMGGNVSGPLVSPRPCAGVQGNGAVLGRLLWTPAQGRGDSRGNDGRRRRAEIRVPGRPIRRKSPCTHAFRPARKIPTGQQWNKASHDETGSPPDAAIRRPGGRGRAFPTSGPAARARGRPRAGG